MAACQSLIQGSRYSSQGRDNSDLSRGGAVESANRLTTQAQRQNV